MLSTLGTGHLSASVHAWHRHHARLLFILGSSWSLENHQLLCVCLLVCRRTLTGSLLVRQRMT